MPQRRVCAAAGVDGFRRATEQRQRQVAAAAHGARDTRRGLRGPSPRGRRACLQAARSSGEMRTQASHSRGGMRCSSSAPAAARCAVRRRRAAAGSRCAKRATSASSRHSGRVVKRGHRRARLAAFADAFERLVVLVFQQRVEAGGLRRHRRAGCGRRSPTRRGLGMNGASARNTKWHFGQTPAPAVGRAFAEQVEVAVAAGEMRVVAVGLRELRARPRARSAAAAASSNAGRRRRVAARSRRSACSHAQPFDHWWFTSPVPLG